MSGLIVLIVFLSTMIVVDGSHIKSRECLSYSKQGDIVLGGVFPFSFASQPVPCTGALSPWAVRLSEAMIFAIAEINRMDDLLPGVRLGFDIRDDCRSEEVALWTAVSLVHSGTNFSGAVEAQCGPTTVGPSVGIVGTGFSETSIYVTKFASLYHVPVVSYAASSDELSDKDRFPFFLRTYPPDRYQVKVILDLLVYFDWEYIGLLYSLQSDGIRGAFALQELAEETGICVAFSSPIPEFASEDELQEVVEKLETHSLVKVVILFGATNEAQSVLSAVANSDMRKIMWIGTTHWGYRLRQGALESVAKGAFFIRDYRPKVPAFGEYFSSLRPSSPDVSPWFKELAEDWMRETNCSDLVDCPLNRGNTEGLVMNSVHAFAHALHDILDRRNASRNATLASRGLNIDGDTLLEALKGTRFTGPYGQVMFDSNGDGHGQYILSNLQQVDGEYKMVDVGWWDAINETRLWMRDELIQWPDDGPELPRSTCRETCSQGYALITLRKRCCTQCTKCPADSIVLNDTMCQPCENLHWPDNASRICLPIVPSAVPLDDPAVVSLLTLVSLGLLCWLLTGIGLVIKRKHHLVKATSRELTFIHFTGLLLAYIASLAVLIWAPSPVSCAVTEFAITASFTMTYAPTLLRVIRIHRIFKAGRVTTRRPRFTSPRTQVIASLIIVMIQMITSIISALIAPSMPTVLYTRYMGNHSEIFCAFGQGFIVSCSLNLGLIAACCLVAFLARKVPDNYNETRFIAVSVYTTLVLVVAAIPVYTSSFNALPKMATICVAVTLNAYMSLVCLYLAKLVAIAVQGKIKMATVNPNPGPAHRHLQVTSSTALSLRPNPMFAWASDNTDTPISSINPVVNAN